MGKCQGLVMDHSGCCARSRWEVAGMEARRRATEELLPVNPKALCLSEGGSQPNALPRAGPEAAEPPAFAERTFFPRKDLL